MRYKCLRCKKRQIGAILLILLSFYFLTGCGAVSSEQRKIYGDDELIAREGDTYTFSTRLGEVEASEANLEFAGFFGMQTMWIMETQKDTEINIHYSLDISSGKVKLVLINPQGTVTTITEQEASDNLSIPLQKGKYRVKLVGSNAKGNIHVSLEDAGPDVQILAAKR
jgi:hypothetical protein